MPGLFGPNPALSSIDKWLDPRRGQLLALAAGIGSNPDFGKALSNGFMGAAQAKPADDAYQASLKADAERQAQISQLAAWTKQNYPQFANLPPEQGFELAKAEMSKAQGATGTYAGTSMDAQNWNIVLKAQSDKTGQAWNDPAVQAAWAQITQPKMTFQQTPQGLVPIMQPPNIPPGWGPPSAASITSDQGGLPMAPPAGTVAAPTATPPVGMGSAPASVAGGISIGTPLAGTRPASTEAQQRMGMLSTSLATSAPEVLKGFDALSDPKQQVIGLGGALTRPWQSEEYQKATVALGAAIADIVPAISGAAFSTQELATKIQSFTPKIGEKPGVIAFKKKLFLSYVQGIANSSNDPEAKAKAQEFLNAIDAPSSPVIDLGGGITMQEIP